MLHSVLLLWHGLLLLLNRGLRPFGRWHPGRWCGLARLSRRRLRHLHPGHLVLLSLTNHHSGCQEQRETCQEECFFHSLLLTSGASCWALIPSSCPARLGIEFSPHAAPAA